jgi:conjugal transfer pilus assembly protein TraW
MNEAIGSATGFTAPARIRVVLFQGATTIVLLACALVTAASHAQTSVIGRTWPIAEPDALEEIEARTQKLPPNMASRFGPRENWSAMKAAPLAVAQVNRVRSVVPFYTLDFDVKLPDGKLLYPKGFTFNPLTYVSLPQRLVVVRPEDLGWALRTASPSDWILLAASARAGADPIALGQKVGRSLFILEERVKDRLGLEVAPVIVSQVGQKLELTEVKLNRTGSAPR